MSASTSDSPSPRTRLRPGPFHNRDFRWFFTSRALADTSTEMGAIAVPLLAITLLQASPGQVGVLGVLSTAAFLLIGLPAGIWVDRTRRRSILVVGNLCHGLVLLSVPMAWFFGVLTLWQLYACVLLGGVTTVFTRVAQQSYLPLLIDQRDLVRANAALTSASSTAGIAGRGAGGYLVQALGATLVVLCNAFALVSSALALLMLRYREPRPERRPDARLLRDIGHGVRYVVTHRLLRPIAMSSVITNLGLNAIIVMVPVMVVTELGLPEGRVGLFFMVGGVGILAGSLSAQMIAGWLGHGRCLWIVGLGVGAGTLAVPLLDTGPLFWVASAGWALSQFGIGVHNVVQISLRQQITPDHLLGRMTATMRFLLTGSLAISAAWAGTLAEFQGARAALWVGAGLCAFCWLPLLLSPLRSMRGVPAHDTEHEEEADGFRSAEVDDRR
ncbi:MFS transporter [Nocardiopsis terrae]|uniref:MFS family permease n=1 Tax=Nocardiopsis terrae TaxID=372655 RepID=A0ABR9HP13_9ACTN|nr:MFS transporter [Nocardiopsis terrae]MBE1460766.1 MFS family permease [Nocardiopsis terrae]GHC73358.1 MFS transporter [Nocardiopsis terrae]